MVSSGEAIWVFVPDGVVTPVTSGPPAGASGTPASGTGSATKLKAQLLSASIVRTDLFGSSAVGAQSPVMSWRNQPEAGMPVSVTPEPSAILAAQVPPQSMALGLSPVPPVTVPMPVLVTVRTPAAWHLLSL